MTYLAVEALQNHSVAAAIDAELAATQSQQPDLSGESGSNVQTVTDREQQDMLRQGNLHVFPVSS